MSYVEYDPYARPREPIKRWTRMDEANLRAKQKEYDQLVNYVAPGEQLHVPQLERDIRYYRKTKKATKKQVKGKTVKRKALTKKTTRKQKYRFGGLTSNENKKYNQLESDIAYYRKMKRRLKKVKKKTKKKPVKKTTKKRTAKQKYRFQSWPSRQQEEITWYPHYPRQGDDAYNAYRQRKLLESEGVKTVYRSKTKKPPKNQAKKTNKKKPVKRKIAKKQVKRKIKKSTRKTIKKKIKKKRRK
jgi:hypothetical protein